MERKKPQAKAKATAKKTQPKAKAVSKKPQTKAKAPSRRAKSAADEMAKTSPLASNVLHTVLTKTAKDVTDINKILRGYLPLEQDLTGTQRRRLIGAKSRNYGFLVKAFEVVDDRPEFIPPNFSLTNMEGTIANLEVARDLVVIAENLQRLVDDFLLQTTDLAFRDALLIYGNLRTQSRANIQGATDVFDQLKQFFTLRRRNRTEPTEKQLEREAKQLLRGKADGEMVIKNKSARMTGGEHEVVEDVRKRGKRGAEMKVKEEE